MFPDDEQHLRDLLTDAANDARPAAGAIAAASRRGRRLRHRQQALAGTAAVVLTGAIAVGAVAVARPQHDGQVQAANPTPQPGQPLSGQTRPVGEIQTVWSGLRNGRPTTVAAWFTAHDLLCLGEEVPGGYQNVSCSGTPDSSGGPGINGWQGTAAGVPSLGDGTQTWYLLSVGRAAARVTVTLTTGTVVTATRCLVDGPQPLVLAIAVAPPHSVARQFTAYDANGQQIDIVHP